MWILIALIAVPLIEIALFIEVGGAVGVWPTIALVVLTALIGSAMLRRQGLATLAALQDELRHGGDPSPLLAHGALLLVAGVLLLTPGFFTDLAGLLLMVPRVRTALIAWSGPKLAARAAARRSAEAHPGATGRQAPGDGPIEVEYRDVTDSPPRDRDPTRR